MARPLIGCMLVYWLIFSGWSLALHRNLDTGIFDLGIHCQAMWLFAQGLPDFLTTRGMPSLADHFTPVLFLLAPLARPELALIFQSVVLASAAWPLYRLARLELEEKPAFGLALAYLLQPGLWSANLFDFHASTLALGTLSWALWGLHSGRPGLYFVSLILTLGEGEALGISVLLLAPEAWRAGRRRTALATFCLGAAGMLVAGLVMRAANGGQGSQYQSLFAQPNLNVSSWLFYCLLLLLPLLFLPLAGWPRLLPVLPVVVANCLSWRDGQRGLDHHYLSSILPFLMWAAVAGLRRWRPPAWSLGLLLVANLLMHRWLLLTALRPHPELVELPAGASVSADNAPGAHLCLRRSLFLFPNPLQPLCWGNRTEAMVETIGQAGQPPLPGSLHRRLEECGLDYIVLSLAQDTWPLRPLDKAYWLSELRRSELYREISPGVFQRVVKAPLRMPSLEIVPRLSGDGEVLVYANELGVWRQVMGQPARFLGAGHSPEVSDDGERVIFVSEAQNLVAGDRNCSADCFLWEAGRLTRLGPDGPPGRVSAYWGGFGPDGQPVVLGYGPERQPAGATGLWIGPVRDGAGTVIGADGWLQPKGVSRISCRRMGRHYQLLEGQRALTAGDIDSLEPSLSRDGQWLAYNRGGRVLLRHGDRQWDLGPGYNPCLSGDGGWLVFARGAQVIWRRVR
ncbi:MAG: DUF2079 domain-containing protein [Candidatus Eremiobacteraeota bacterium]|nr:DUF2079 domain-containing protein [Candidatus Eremiobacteraeota bacterium]